MKKFIAMLLVCLMVVAVLTSCPKPVEKDNDTTTTTEGGASDPGEQPKEPTPHEKTLAALTKELNLDKLGKLLNANVGTAEMTLAPENAPFTSITSKVMRNTNGTIINVVANVNDTDYKVNVFENDKKLAANFENLNNIWYGFNLENLANQFGGSAFAYVEGSDTNILTAEQSELVKSVLADIDELFTALNKKELDADTKAAVDAFVNVIKANVEKISKTTENVTVDGYEAECTTYTIDTALIKGLLNDVKGLLDNEKVVALFNKVFDLVEKYAAKVDNGQVVTPVENDSVDGENADVAEDDNDGELPPIEQPDADITALLNIDAIKGLLDQASAMVDTFNFKLIAKTYVAGGYLTKVEASFALAMAAEAPEALEADDTAAPAAELVDIASVALDFGKTPSFANGVKATVKIFNLNSDGDTGIIDVTVKGENTDAKLAVTADLEAYADGKKEETLEAVKLAFNYDKTAKTYAFTTGFCGVELFKAEGKFAYTENSFEFSTDKVTLTEIESNYDEETDKSTYTAGKATVAVVNFTVKFTADTPTVTVPEFTNVFEMTKGNIVDLVEEINTKFPSQVDPEPVPAE